MWGKETNIMGPSGPPGLTGPAGPPGPQGVPGPIGPVALVSDTPPVGAADNSLWFESDTGLLYILYRDADSVQWVIAAPQPDVATFVKKAGDTMGGPLILAADPATPLGAATKQYVDAVPKSDPTKVLKSGDTMTGDLNGTLFNSVRSDGSYGLTLTNSTTAHKYGLAASGGDGHFTLDDMTRGVALMSISATTGALTVGGNVAAGGTLTVTGNAVAANFMFPGGQNGMFYDGANTIMRAATGGFYIQNGAGSANWGSLSASGLTVAGIGSFGGEVRANLGGTAFRLANGTYGTLLYSDAGNFYIMQTAAGDQYGSYNANRPFYITQSNGLCYINSAVPVSNGRLAYVGDYNNAYNAGLAEPYPGACITGQSGFIMTQNVITSRFRYVQLYSSGWFTVGTA